MVLNLSISRWQGQRLDKDASRRITTESGADADAARVNKHLVPKDALAPVVTAANAVRDHFYTKTLPWRDNGDRLLTRKLYMPFIEEHERLVAEFDAAVEKFLVEDYPKAIDKAAFRMGDLFKSEDYPPVGHLRHRFRIELDISAISTANDFRVQIDQEHADKVRAQMESAAEQRVTAAMTDIWQRLAKTIGYFHERMADPSATFRDTTVENVAELIDLIPGLNVLDDPEIEEVRQMVKRDLGGIDAQDIRKDPELRAELADDAKQIMSKVEGFMKAFGGGQE